MGEVPALKIRDRASVSEARILVREAARAAGLSEVETEQMAFAVSELAQNQLDHARDGAIHCRTIERRGVRGVEISASDLGPGIDDPASAIAGLLPGKGLGVGLAGVRRAVDEIDVDVRLGEATTLTVRKFAAAVPRQPEVAVIGQGVERPSGDGAVIRREGELLSLAVIDGGGHGPLACAAAERAAEIFRSAPHDLDLVALFERLHDALKGTRGAAAALARWDLGLGSLTVAGVGNASVRLYEPAVEGHAAQSTAGMLGSRWVAPPRIHRLRPGPRAVLVLATDGISSRIDPVYAEIGRAAPHIATQIFSTARKGHDDALVIVAK